MTITKEKPSSKSTRTATPDSSSSRRRIHVVMAPKGGVGKSVASLIIGSYYDGLKKEACFIDADPQNANLARVKRLGATYIKVTDGTEVITAGLDELVELSITSEVDVVVDVGAASYYAIAELLTIEGFADVVHEQGKVLTANIIVAGGPRYLDTINGLNALSEQLPETSEIIVWKNPYLGAFEYEGKPFEASKVYQRHSHRFSAIVELPKLRARDYGRDFEAVIANNHTLDEAIASPETKLMAKQRLTQVRDQFFAKLDATKAFN